jgi:hypothetical protein
VEKGEALLGLVLGAAADDAGLVDPICSALCVLCVADESFAERMRDTPVLRRVLASEVASSKRTTLKAILMVPDA